MNKIKKILIIDNQSLNLELLNNYILDIYTNIKILKSTTGILGLNLSIKEIPDLIITDWNLPDFTGIELIDSLKKNKITANIPIIVCSDLMLSSENLRIALASGANDFIRKPIDKIEFQARVNLVLQLSEFQRRTLKRKKLFKSTFESSNIGMCLISKKGKFLKTNQIGRAHV